MTKLGRVLKQADTVIFVGSGISLWSGLPSWAGLIQELCAYLELHSIKTDLVSAELRRGDLLQAASYGFDKLTKSQIGDFVRSSCRLGSAVPGEIHRRIVTLGPRCFVTTNYDDLLERAHREKSPQRHLRVVTNRQLTEMADIVHARASDFLFKPHGDAGDSESIILTKEQYRLLLPQGERHAALEALKTILVSRPVVYLGFGLRDPDFNHLKDVISNTYRGGEREHYAVMPDISQDEEDYWRRNYGVNLIGYKTVANENGGRDHGDLLQLLHQAACEAGDDRTTETFNIQAPLVVLALARHAVNISRTPRIESEIPILAVPRNSDNRRHFFGQPVETLLQESTSRIILCGLPGSGKTYALKRAAAKHGEALHVSSLAESFDTDGVTVPVFIDLKLYRGSLAALISEALPAGIPFSVASKCIRFCFYLDSFNEMPREYLDDGTFASDFAEQLGSRTEVSVVLGSRTLDGLEKFEYPVFDLDDIDQAYVLGALREAGVAAEGSFFDELLDLFRKPFYFQLLSSGAIELPERARPKDIYESLLREIESSVESRFETKLDLRAALSMVAYDAVDEGLEAFESKRLLIAIAREMRRNGVSETEPLDVVNWLVSRSLIIPHPNGLVSFVHQSVTEYLAAFELARIFTVTPDVLIGKLALHRWDQALFLTLGMLSPVASEDFTSRVLSANFVLAVNAAKYVEYGQSSLVSRLLQEIIDRRMVDNDAAFVVASALERGLAVSEVHVPLLRLLMGHGGMVGGKAAAKLLQIRGSEAMPEVLEQVYLRPDDYNFSANGVAPDLLKIATRDDLLQILAAVEQMEGGDGLDDEKISGILTLGAALMGELKISDLRLIMGDIREFVERRPIATEMICNALWEDSTTENLALAGELLLYGAKGAVVALSFIVGPHEDRSDLDWSSFSVDHAEILWSHVMSGDSWALRALRCQLNARSDVRQSLVSILGGSEGSIRAALAYVCGDDDEVFEVLKEFADGDGKTPDATIIGLLSGMKLDWRGKETILLGLLTLRISDLATNLIDSLHIGPDGSDLRVEVGDVEWWLRWMMEVDDFMFRDRLGQFLCVCASTENGDSFLDEIGRVESPFKRIVAEHILGRRFDLTTDHLSRDAIEFLIEDVQVFQSWHGHMLGAIATERFVEGRMLPLLGSASAERAALIRDAIRQAGDRHGRRYDLAGVPWA